MFHRIGVAKMSIEPMILGVVSKNAHPLGCEQSVLEQIEYATVNQTKSAPSRKKRVLVLGASSGLGLASRIALTFGGDNADTIGVSFETSPNDIHSGSAGFYNNYFFKQHAEKAGHLAINIQGDLFSDQTKTQVIEAIETYFEGEVDLIVYSIAASKRITKTQTYHSVIKPLNQAISATFIDFSNDSWIERKVEAANEQDIISTLKTMGGEEWENWIDSLINSESIAQGCQTVAFSYIGSDITHPIYLDGTLGHAKIDLHQTSHHLHRELANFKGSAFAVVCQALVTRSSVVTPNLCPYVMALNQALENLGQFEGPIQQMQRLFYQKLAKEHDPKVDSQRLVRLDKRELSPTVQQKIKASLADMTAANFAQYPAYTKLKNSFLQLSGFAWDNIDYNQPVDYAAYLDSNTSN
jgi:enoyl-[acyl-carrier protein] reductase/trans-2-enoyl-CoA reductase (NAD+)